jgi:parallel beta-helix repeat protein
MQHQYLRLLLVLCFTLTLPAEGHDIGGTCGGAVPCDCGDQVIASRTLVPGVDPITTKVCPDSGLVILGAHSLTLNMGGAIIRGSGKGFGVDIAQATKVTVKKGVIIGFSDGIRGITIHESKISNNLVFGNDVTGIRLLDAAGTVVDHNLALDNGLVGIDLFSSSRNRIRHNTLHRNGFDGILINATDAVVVKGNRSLRNSNHGIVVVNSTSCEVRNNSVVSNISDGLLFVSTADCSVTRNVTNQNRGNGILVSTTQGGDAFRCNLASGNGDTDPALFDCTWDGSDAPTFAKNRCETENPSGVWSAAGPCSTAAAR